MQGFFVSNSHKMHTQFVSNSHKTVRPSSQQEYATSFTRAPACCSSRDRLILTTSSYDAKTPDERSCLRSSFTRSDAVEKMLSGFPNSLQHRRSKKRERLQTKRLGRKVKVSAVSHFRWKKMGEDRALHQHQK